MATATGVVIRVRMNFQPVICELGRVAKAARYAADQFDFLNIGLPGAWPDYFVLLSRRFRYGFHEKAFGGELDRAEMATGGGQ